LSICQGNLLNASNLLKRSKYSESNRGLRFGGPWFEIEGNFAAGPGPRGKQGQDYTLWSILSLVMVGLLCGRRGLKAAFLLGRSMTARQRNALGFMNGTTPCHATLTETVRAIDARALADILGALDLAAGNDARHIAIDGKTMRASKDGEGKAVH